MTRIWLVFFLLCLKTVYSDSAILSSKERINEDLKRIVNTRKPRNYKNVDILNSVADYIFTEFKEVSENVEYQVFKVKDNEYKNVICSLGPLMLKG